MIVTRLHEFPILTLCQLPNTHEGNAGAKKLRKGNLFRLEFRIRKLNAKCNSQAVALRRIQRQAPDWVKVKLSRTRLHIAPVTANVKHIYERQAGDFFNLLIQRLVSSTHRQ